MEDYGAEQASNIVEVSISDILVEVSLSASETTITFGQEVIFTVTVTIDGSWETAPDGGWVHFYYNGQYPGTAQVVNGEAVFSTDELPVGEHAIDAFSRRTAIATGRTSLTSSLSRNNPVHPAMFCEASLGHDTSCFPAVDCPT